MSSWNCFYCGEVNPASVTRCRDCGTSRFALAYRRPTVTEEPIPASKVVRASRTFRAAVRELNVSTRFVHDQIREHMGVPE